MHGTAMCTSVGTLLSCSNNSASYNGGGMSAWDHSNVYTSGNTNFSGNSAIVGVEEQ